METKKLTIKKWVDEEQEYLEAEILKTIADKLRLHIKAPTGRGKTTLYIDITEGLYSLKQIIILVPQIAIGNSVYTELEKRGIRAFRFNGETRDDFKEEDLNYPIIATIDSAFILFNPDYEYCLDPSRAVIFSDETHAYIQEGKPAYDKTMRAIDAYGCPLIGFSATPVGWVIKHLLKIDKSIIIEATEIPKKEVYPVKVGRGIPAVLAHYIKEDKLDKVVIFTQNIEDQNRIRKEIESVDPSKKCTVLNRPSRLDEEKKKWNKLLKTGLMPKNTNVLLMNKVAQAGININDEDIDAVFMVGNFDPIGFIQYIGRCRFYTEPIYYLYTNYGKQYALWEGTDKHEEYQKAMQAVIDYITTTEIININSVNSLFENMFTVIEGKGAVLNKCVYANHKYQGFYDLDGDTLMKFIAEFEPTIDVKAIGRLDSIESKINKKVQYARRGRLRKGLIQKIEKYSRYIYPMIDYLEDQINHTKALQLILNSKSNRRDANRNNALYIPATKLRYVKQAFKDANEIGIGVPKLIVAAKKYFESSDKQDIEAALDISNNMVVKAINSYVFYNNGLVDKGIVAKVLDKLEQQIDSSSKSEEWKSWINQKLGNIPGSDALANKIYDYCCIMKIVQITVDGAKYKRRRLDKVVRNHTDFLDEHPELKGIYD